MTKEQLAQELNGREYGNEITSDENNLAKEHDLVVVTGASDDIVLFRGAFYDEAYVHEDLDTIYLNENGLLKLKCDNEDCPYAELEQEKCKTIDVTFEDGDWVFKTEIPHTTFDIYEDGMLYCVGIVFEMAALKGSDNE